MSELGWVDFSSNDRDLVSKIMSMMAEPGTLDELGIGQIRDAFSDYLFPGFSTIQTRARYFLAVPQIFRDYFSLPRKDKKKQPLEDYLKQQENELARWLVDNHSRHNKPLDGIIGHTLVEKGGAARRPSSIYWNGLRAFGIVNTTLSLTEFCRTVASHDERCEAVAQDDVGSDDHDAMRRREVVRPIPGTGEGWMAQVHIALSKSEATFLQDQILFNESIVDGVPAQLLASGLLPIALQDRFASFGALSVWLRSEGRISASCRKVIDMAEQFSRRQIGAQIRLDCLVAKRLNQAERLEQWEAEYQQWVVEARREGLFQKDVDSDWIDFARMGGVKVRPKTAAFLKAWNEHLVAGSPTEALDELVRKRCLDNKKEHSVLRRTLPADTGQVGVRVLDYRWVQARRILTDVQEGLAC